jgi:Replication initiation factor
VDDGRVSLPLYRDMNLEVLEARVDWISCSGRIGSWGFDLGVLAGDGIIHESERGEKVRPWSTHGYAGFAAGRWRWASTKESVIAQVSQNEAQHWAQALAQKSDHWSRIDYCVTVLDKHGAISPGAEYWLAWHDGHGVKRRNADLTRISEAWGGTSIFIGSRSSSHYLRCYDKHAESDGLYPKGSWRWEVELKGNASEHEHEWWRNASMDGRQCAGLVSGAFHHYGLPVPWSTSGRITQYSSVSRVADADRSLRWFETQVKPSVAFVKKTRGLLPVTDALGLTDDILRQGTALRLLSGKEVKE